MADNHLSPHPSILDLEDRAERFETPCGNGSMIWRRWGKGRPLLLLHGSHGSWMHWVRNIPALAANRQLLAPDIPGYGESAPAPIAESADSHAAAIAEGLGLLTAGQGPVDVAGFSLGAMIGSHLAALAPQLVRRLIIVDAGGLNTPSPPLSIKSIRSLSGEELREAHRHNLLEMMIHSPDAVDELALFIQAKNTPLARSRVHFEVIPDKLLIPLPRIQSQIDAIWGEHDYPHPNPELNFAVLRGFQPDAECHIIPGAGHWSMYEGAEDFNAVLGELLDQPLRASREPLLLADR